MMLLYFWVFPLAAALVLALCGRRQSLAQLLNIGASLVWALLFILIWGAGEHNSLPSQGPTVLFNWSWFPFLKSHFSLGVDQLSLPLLGLNVLLNLCLAFYAWKKPQLNAAYLALFNVLNCAAAGSLLATDAFLFYVFWEFMLIPMYFLIGRWGSKKRVYAALKFFAFTMGGSLFLLAAILALAANPQVTSLGWADILKAHPVFAGWASPQGLLFLGFMAAFAVKIPVWPLHTWLPDAHTEAPTGASVILAGILLKLGVYGMARWCLPLFPEASKAAAPVMLGLGCAGIVLGALAAWSQKDIKRMIAYSSVSHLGFMVLGLFALREESLQGALFQNLAHGLSTGALFLIFGIIYDRTHTRELSDYGGLAQRWPTLAALFVFATMASIGLPGLPGFVGEFLVLSGTYFSSPVAALVAVSGVLLGAIYMLALVRKAIFGPPSETVAHHLEEPLRWSEWTAIVPLTVAMLLLGLGPQFLLSRAGPAVSALLGALR